RITVSNRGPEAAELHLLPTLWFRNHWSWGRTSEEHGPKPSIRAAASDGGVQLLAEHHELGGFVLDIDSSSDATPELLFTDNESNGERLWSVRNSARYPKDAFHDHVIAGDASAVNPERVGTKAAAHFRLRIGPGNSVTLRLRLAAERSTAKTPFGRGFDEVFEARMAEADEFYAERIPARLSSEERAVSRQAYAGLLWSKQFYHYVVPHWLEGDPAQPPP